MTLATAATERPRIQPDRAQDAAASDEFLTVGLDVGGTKTACVVTDAQDRVLLHEVVPTDSGRLAEALSDLVRSAVKKVAAHGSASAGRVAAVGICVPGRVETDTGNIRLAVNLGGTDLALGRIVTESVGLPCYVEHDARAAAAWIESSPDNQNSTPDLAYLSVGTGISAGIVLDGRVLRGANGLAGEVGHTSAEPDDGRCACGLVGCVEAVTAGPAIARAAQAAAHDAAVTGATTSLTADASATDLFNAAAAGDPIARQLASKFAERLARAIRALVLTLGVNRIYIGGGVAGAGDALLRPVLAAIDRERAASPLVEAAFADVRVEILLPHVEAGARGVAAIARRRVLAEQRQGVG